MPIIVTKRSGTCADCGNPIPAGSRARWFKGIGILCLTPCQTRDNVVALPGVKLPSETPPAENAPKGEEPGIIPTFDPTITDEDLHRGNTIKRIKRALQIRSGKERSVSGDKGTAYGWIHTPVPSSNMGAPIIPMYLGV